MSASKKHEEGLEHIKAAEKCLKTSFMKWRPDYGEAADEYNQAATCFRNAKSFEQCKDCLLKSAECHVQNRGLFYAAKALDQAILVCKEIGSLREIPALVEKAANYYQSHGSADTAAASLEKAAKIIEQQHVESALPLYQRAADICLTQDNQRQAAEHFSKAARILVKLGNYDTAVDVIRRELGIHIENESYQAAGRLAVALILVQLARGDIVAAEKAFKEWGNCCDPAEINTIEMLLQAFDEDDAESAKQALSSPFIRHMDVEYAILARDMPLPEGMKPHPKANVIEKAAPEYVSIKNKVQATIEGQVVDKNDSEGASNAKPQEEDEEDEGLC